MVDVSPLVNMAGGDLNIFPAKERSYSYESLSQKGSFNPDQAITVPALEKRE
jgi:hypothetical protein